MTEKTPDDTNTGPDPLEALEQRAAAAEAAEQEQESQALAGELQTRDAQRERDEQRQQSAELGAIMAVNFAETVLCFFVADVQVPADRKQKLIEKTAPVLAKYDAGLPAWLKPYQEEIDLGMTLAATGWGIAMQVRAQRAEQANPRKKQTGNEQARSGATVTDLDLVKKRRDIPHATPGTVTSAEKS